VNCRCVYVTGGETGWDCTCPQGSFYADTKNFTGNYGCPGNSYYGTNGCCTCVETDHTCPEGCFWVDPFCACYNANGPCVETMASPSPGNSGGPGNTEDHGHEAPEVGCTNYYWVWFESADGGETWTPTGLVEYAGCF
jgi:hypothetical protein